MVVLNEAELTKEVLTNISDFPKLYFKAGKLLAPGISSYDGEKWAKHRKIINQAFHVEKLKVLLCLLLEERTRGEKTLVLSSKIVKLRTKKK